MRASAATTVALLAVVAAQAAAPTTATTATTWNIVALGDSDTTGNGDPTRLGWVGRYARLLHQRLGLRVTVNNLADEGKTSDELLSEVRSDPTTRAALKGAEVVLVGIGGADLNAGDDRLSSGSCTGTRCYAADLRRYASNIDKIAAAIRSLRARNQAVLRTITLPNVVPGAGKAIPPFITAAIGVFQTTTIRKAVCAAMSKHAGRCVDALRALNGPKATGNAYANGWLTKDPCCYPSGRGQQRIAELVLETGLAPLR